MFRTCFSISDFKATRNVYIVREMEIVMEFIYAQSLLQYFKVYVMELLSEPQIRRGNKDKSKISFLISH